MWAYATLPPLRKRSGSKLVWHCAKQCQVARGSSWHHAKHICIESVFLSTNLKGTHFASRSELTSFLSKTLPIHLHTGDTNAGYLQQLVAVLFT